MWSYPGPQRRRFGRLALDRRSVVASPETIGLTWLWAYLMFLVLFSLWLAAIHPSHHPETVPRLANYTILWLGDHGGLASLQLTVMSIQVLMVIYLWLRYRGLRHHRRVPLAAYLLLAGTALLLLAQQQVFRGFSSQLESPHAIVYPETRGIPIPDPNPETP